jgi:hypothetical protein
MREPPELAAKNRPGRGGNEAPPELAEPDRKNGPGSNGRKPTVSEGRWAKLAARAIVDRSLKSLDVRILACIGIYSGRDGTAWPSQETIARALGIERATVCRSIKRLRTGGYLDRYRKRTPRGHFRNVYRLLYPAYVPLLTDAATPEM